MKRFLSVLLAVVMLVSMVTISYAAEEKITVEYINANTTEIILELSKEIPDFQNHISLKKNGVDVETFAVSKIDPTPEPDHKEHTFVKKSATEYFSVRALTANTNPTYVIRPAGGLAFDAKYALLISGEALCGDGYRADIVVNKIFVDEFNYTDSTSPWKKNSSGTVSYSTKAMTLNPSTAVYLGNNNNTFADSGVTLNTWLNDNNGGYKLRDKINLEIKASFADTSVKHNVGLGLSRTVALSTGTGKAISVTVGGDANGKKHTGILIYQGSTGGDPKYTDYPEGTTPTANYASAINVPSKLSGYYNYVSYPHEYAMALDNTTTAFESGVAKNVSMYYDSVEDKVIYSGAGDYYNYSYDMPDFDVRARATIFNYGSDNVTVTNFKASYPTITETVIKAYSFGGPTYWNAASDTITLDFDAPLTAASIKDKIKLYDAQGNTVAISSVTALNDVTREANFTGKYTYEIKLADLFEDEGIYTLVLPKGSYLDQNNAPATLSNDYTVTFKMDLFVLETFDYKAGSNAVYTTSCVSNFPWAIFSTGKYGQISVEGTEDNPYLMVDNTASSSTTTGRTWISPNIPTSTAGGFFANTGMSGSDYSQKSNALRKTSDYTMEADVKVVQEGSSGYQIRMYQSRERMSLSKVPHNELTVEKSAEGEITIGTYAYGENGVYVKDHMATTDVDLAGDEFVRISMAIKGIDHRWTVGDSLVHEVVAPDEVTAQEIGIPVFDIDDKKVNNIYHIDNLFLTKATEIDAMDCSDIVINGDSSIKQLPTSGAVNASVTLTNKGQAKSFAALLVVYNSADESIVGVYESEVNSIDAAATKEVTFANADVSKGDRIEVYIWDNCKNLTPYVESKVLSR